MFDELHNWLLITDELESCLELVDDSAFGLSTDFVIAVTDDDNYELYDIYNTGKSRGGKLKVNLIGYWNESSRLNITADLDKKIRWNLEGMKLRLRGNV